MVPRPIPLHPKIGCRETPPTPAHIPPPRVCLTAPFQQCQPGGTTSRPGPETSGASRSSRNLKSAVFRRLWRKGEPGAKGGGGDGSPTRRARPPSAFLLPQCWGGVRLKDAFILVSWAPILVLLRDLGQVTPLLGTVSSSVQERRGSPRSTSLDLGVGWAW